MPAKIPYQIEVIAEADHEATLEFLRLNYYRDAPLNKYLGNDTCPELEKWCVDLLAGTECQSFKATIEDGTIVGVFLNAKISSTDKFAPNLEECSTPNFRVEMEFLEFIDREYNLWKAYPQFASGLEAGVLSVNPEFRGMGIAKKLTERTVQHAREAGFPIILCHCSSVFSAAVCEATGFKRTYQLAYEDYVVDGKRPLKPEEPHSHFQVYVYEL